MDYSNNKEGKGKMIGMALAVSMLGIVAHSAFAEISTTATVGATIATSSVTATAPVAVVTQSADTPSVDQKETEKIVPTVSASTSSVATVNTVTALSLPVTTVNNTSSIRVKEKETEKTTQPKPSSRSVATSAHKQVQSRVTLEDKDDSDKVSGNTKVSVKVEEKEKVATVEVNLTRERGGESLYIGKAHIDSTDTQGVVSWDSANTPDGSYELTTLITKQDGEVVQGDSVTVVVKNDEEKWVKTKDTTSLGNSSVREVSRQFVAEKFVEDIKSTQTIKEDQIKKEITNTLKTFSEKKEVTKNVAKETVFLNSDIRETSVHQQKQSPDFEKVVDEKAKELKEAFSQGDNEKKREIVNEIVETTRVLSNDTPVANGGSENVAAQDVLVKNIEAGVAKLEQVAIEQQSGVVDVENFEVSAVAVAEVVTKPDGTKTASKVSFKGKALPNSFATLYIFSIPIVVTVKTDNDGYWNYTLDKELENGEHKVFVAITDVKGAVVAKSEPLPFVKEASAITVEQALPVAGNSPSFVENSYFYGSIITIILIVAAIFVLLGIKMKDTPQQ